MVHMKALLDVILMIPRKRGKSYRKSFHLLRESINNYVQNVSRNMDSQCHCDEILDGNEEFVIILLNTVVLFSPT